MTLKIPDSSFYLPCFEARRAEVFAVQIAIAQRAKKTPAAVAWKHGFLARMIKAGCLAIDQRNVATPLNGRTAE